MFIDPLTCSDGGYIQIRSTGCLPSVCWRTPTGQWTWVAAWQPVLERSIMSWQEGEGSDVLACPEGPAPVSLMRLPLTGDVVVGLCVRERTCVGVDFHRGWTSASLAWLPQLNCLLLYLARLQQPYVLLWAVSQKEKNRTCLHFYLSDFGR